MKTVRTARELTVLVALVTLLGTIQGNAQNKWTVPDNANQIVNPIKDDDKSAVNGKKTFKMLCVVCHGPKGNGDGIGSTGLPKKPADLNGTEFQSQSDGAIFWKIAHGRTPMPAYKASIPELKIWELINYIRTLK